MNRLPEASVVTRPREVSQYYMGFYPCQERTFSPDASRITDYSGNEAHAGLRVIDSLGNAYGALTEAEAWDTPGFFHSLAEEEHCGLIPIEKWPHRFLTGSLLLYLTLRYQDDGSTRRIFGNGISINITGFQLCVTATGQLQIVMQNSSTNASSNVSTGGSTFNSLATYTVGFGYNLSNRSIYLGIDGAFSLTANTNIASAFYDTVDAAFSRPMSIGHRPDGDSSLSENLQCYIHAFNFPGMDLPANLADTFTQYKAAPYTPFVDGDFTWP